ncbi:putative uncharacterized protein DANCR isoform X2 [Mirounga angustirostris]|uniref:putative uncharacterized protein DANCR isoform X2 n=1 Tax=Mirounga angustirostris TaxID=9716 RepID=UPI00313AD6DD
MAGPPRPGRRLPGIGPASLSRRRPGLCAARPSPAGVPLRCAGAAAAALSRVRGRPACGCGSPARPDPGTRESVADVCGLQRPELYAQVEYYRYRPRKLEYSDAGIFTDLYQFSSLQYTLTRSNSLP